MCALHKFSNFLFSNYVLFVAGVYTRYSPFLKRDKVILKKLLKVIIIANFF